MKNLSLVALLCIVSFNAFSAIRISGTIKMDGEPRKNIKVKIKSSTSAQSQAVTKENGSFILIADDLNWDSEIITIEIISEVANVVSPDRGKNNTVPVAKKESQNKVIETSSAMAVGKNATPEAGYKFAYYSIRIMALKTQLDTNKITEIETSTKLSLIESKKDGWYIYSLGSFDDLESAEKALTTFPNLDKIPNVAAGKKYSICSILKAIPNFWRMQIGTYFVRPPEDELIKLRESASKLNYRIRLDEERDAGGVSVYFCYLDFHRPTEKQIRADITRLQTNFPGSIPVEFEFAEKRVLSFSFPRPTEYSKSSVASKPSPKAKVNTKPSKKTLSTSVKPKRKSG